MNVPLNCCVILKAEPTFSLVNMKTLLILFVVFPLFSLTASAQGNNWIPPEKAEIDTIVDLMYNMDFVKVEKRLDVWIKKYPYRPEGYFLQGMNLWVQVLVDLNNPFLDSQFQDKMDEVIDKCEDLEDIDSMETVAQFYKSGAIGFKARLYGNRDNWFSAARYGIKALDGIEDAIDGKYTNEDAKFGAGLYYYYAEIIPKDYPMIKPLLWFYPKGDRVKGLKLIEESADHGLFTQTESKYYLGLIYWFHEKDNFKAYPFFRELSDKYPRNAQFILNRGRLAYAIGNNRDADSCFAVMEARINSSQPFYYPHQLRYLYYYRGILAESRNNAELAFTFYEEAIKPVDPAIHKETEQYYIWSMIRSANMMVKMGFLKEAEARYRQVLAIKEYSNSHKRAKDGLASLGITVEEKK